MALFSLDKKYISVLENYQTLLGNLSSMESSPLVQDTIKQINHLLSSQGYKAVHYTDELSNLFDSKIGECTEAEEYKPAILKSADNKETIILKGGVVLPNKQPQQ